MGLLRPHLAVAPAPGAPTMHGAITHDPSSRHPELFVSIPNSAKKNHFASPKRVASSVKGCVATRFQFRVACAGLPGGGLSNKAQSTNPSPAPLARPWPARAAPRSSPLFAPRPLGTWVSRQTGREAVKSNGRRAVTPASFQYSVILQGRGMFDGKAFLLGEGFSRGGSLYSGPCFQSFSNSGTKGPP